MFLLKVFSLHFECKAPDAMTVGHWSNQLGVWGDVSPPVGPGQSTGEDQGPKSPGPLKILQLMQLRKAVALNQSSAWLRIFYRYFAVIEQNKICQKQRLQHEIT